MEKKSNKKTEPAQQAWKRPCDIKVTRTADEKTMLGKYIAEDVYERWTEDFIDEGHEGNGERRAQAEAL